MNSNIGPIRAIQPLTIPSLDQFPDGTEVLPPGRECIYTKIFGTWYPLVVSMVGLDPFGDGSLAFIPGGETPYVKHTRRGEWLLTRTSPDHFPQVEAHSRQDMGNRSTELLPPPLGVAHSSASVARRIQDEPNPDTVTFNVSVSGANIGRVDNPDSPAFTGEFAEHQKARVSYELDVLNPHPGQPHPLNLCPKQINIRAQKKGPYSRARIAQLLAKDIQRAWEIAKPQRAPLLYDGVEVGLEHITLRDVRRFRRGGIIVALDFTPRRA